eukprot:23269-Pelagococcus_subviridis.AAC.7
MSKRKSVTMDDVDGFSAAQLFGQGERASAPLAASARSRSRRFFETNHRSIGRSPSSSLSVAHQACATRTTTSSSTPGTSTSRPRRWTSRRSSRRTSRSARRSCRPRWTPVRRRARRGAARRV